MPEDQPSTVQRSVRRRLVWSVGVAAGAVVGASLLVPSYGRPPAGARPSCRAARHPADTVQAAAAEAKPHAHPATTVGDGPTVSIDGHTPTTTTRRPRTPSRGPPVTRDGRHREPDHPGPGRGRRRLRRPAAQRARAEARAPGQEPGPSRRAAGPLRDGRRLLRPAGGRQRPLGRPRRGRLQGRTGLPLDRAPPLHFQATDLGSYLLYGTRKASSRARSRCVGRPDRRVRRLPASTPTGRSPRPARLPLPDRHGGTSPSRPAARSSSSTRHEPFRLHTRPAAPRGPRSRPTSAAARSRASRRSRRSAASSTRTPTGWPSSSSAATCTAAGPGRRTASPWR